MKRKTIVSSLLTIVLCLSLIAGSTYALFTSEDSVNIAVTSGKVKVTATVANLATYSMGEATATIGKFANGGTAVLNQETATDMLTLTNITPGDKATFDIDVKNESNVAILYRLVWTVDGALANALVATADNETIANGKTAWAKWEGESTKTIAVSVELPVEDTTQGESATISFAVEAVQGNSPVVAPEDAAQAASAEDLLTAFENGGAVVVSQDISIGTGSTMDITLNNDVSLYMEEGAELLFTYTTKLVGEGTLTVYGGELKTNHELCVTGNATLIIEDGEHTFGAFSATSNGKIIVNGGTLNCKGSYAGIMGISFAGNGSLVVNDGQLNMYQPFNLNANRCDNAYIEINGGTIDLLNGIENLFVVRNIMDKDNESGTLRGSSVRVNGGTFIAHYEIDSAGDATSFIRNGDAPADGNKVLVSNADKYDCIVTGGTFFGSWQRADNQRYVDGNGGYSDGLFVENSIAGFVAEGYEITGDADNGYVVTKK